MPHMRPRTLTSIQSHNMKSIFAIASALMLSINAFSSHTFVISDTAIKGDAQAWRDLISSQIYPLSIGENYKSKYLNVPPAMNQGGVFPTCAAMIMFYHNEQLHYFPSTITDFLTPQSLAHIASPEYFADYYYPDDSNTYSARTDRSGTLGNRSNNHIIRPNNCVADSCSTSQSHMGVRSGMTLIHKNGTISMTSSNGSQYLELRGYGSGASLLQLENDINQKLLQADPANQTRISINMIQYQGDTLGSLLGDNEDEKLDFYWEKITNNIDANQPLIGILGDGSFFETPYIASTVTIVGYASDPIHQAFAAYNTASHQVQWYFLKDKLQGLITFDFTSTAENTLVDNVVHRFFNPNTGAYFFTAFKTEAQAVIDNLPIWQYQGPVFKVEYGETPQNSPVYRFYNKKAGAHFYTINESEKDNVIANLSETYNYEGIAFYARSYAQAYDPSNPDAETYYPIWRCYLPATASHYFTASAQEVEYIQTNVSPDLIKVEGIAWYSDYIYDIP